MIRFLMVFAAVFTLTSSAAEPQWSLRGEAVLENGKLKIKIPETKKKGVHGGSVPIDLSELRGQWTTFSIKMRSRGIQADKNNKKQRGAQFKVCYVKPDGSTVWHHSWDSWDTTDWAKYAGKNTDDWRELTFLSHLDKEFDSARLVLGTENNSGEIEFDLNSFRFYPLFAPSVSTEKCEYTHRVSGVPRLRGVAMRSGLYREADFKTLNEWNVNLVRYPISRYPWEHNARDLNELEKILDERLNCFDKIHALAEKYGIRIILCFALPPGGRERDATFAMQSNPVFEKAFYRFWRKIAAHVKGKSMVFGYDLINEPSQTRKLPLDYLTLQRRAAEEIRKVDPDTPIIVEANLLASPAMFQVLDTLPMKDVIYQLHMYYPDGFTHSNAGAYPGRIYGKSFHKEILRAYLQPVIDFQKRHRARIYVGEFSARSRAVGAERYLRDCIELFEEYGWDWTYHSFREAGTWDVEKMEQNGKHVPVPETPRKKVLLNALKKNKIPETEGL